MKKIDIGNKQIGELAELCSRYELLSDMNTAAKIFKAFMSRYSAARGAGERALKMQVFL